MMARRMAALTLVVCGAACAGPHGSHTTNDLVSVSLVSGDRSDRVLTVAPASGRLRLNAKSPPRFIAADGRETALGGGVDSIGETFTSTASGRISAGAGTLRASVCDAALGVCRTTQVAIDR